MLNFVAPLRFATALLIAVVGGSAAQAGTVAGQGNWETSLQGRYLTSDTSSGFQAFYDKDLDVTWLASPAGNAMSWDSAKSWVASLTIGGITGWRLPNNVASDAVAGCGFAHASASAVTCGVNSDPTQTELAHLYYVTLGNSETPDTTAVSGLANSGPFVKLPSGSIWASSEYAPYTSDAWYFDTYQGVQGHSRKYTALYALAVHAGDVGVGAVPEPGTWALMLLGFGGALLARRRAVRTS